MAKWTLTEDQQKFLDELLEAQCSSKNTVKVLIEMQTKIVVREKEIRADQTRIVKNACAEDLALLETTLPEAPGPLMIDQDMAISAIMNTKAI